MEFTQNKQLLDAYRVRRVQQTDRFKKGVVDAIVKKFQRRLMIKEDEGIQRHLKKMLSP